MKIDVFAAFRCELVSASTPSVVLHERGQDDKKTLRKYQSVCSVQN